MEEDKHQESERMDGGGDAWAPSVQSHRAVDGIGGGGGRGGGGERRYAQARREEDANGNAQTGKGSR